MIELISRCRARAQAAVLLAGLGLSATAVGASTGSPLADRANVDVGNVASLQRGARNFINYCMGCHSAQYVRYNRLAQDLQITEKQ